MLDVAADVTNTVASTFYTESQNGLKHPWYGRVFCNPPYNNILPWVLKAQEEVSHPATRVGSIVMLLPARTSAGWFRQLSKPPASYIQLIEFLPKRVQFDPPPGVKYSSNPEGSLLVVMWPNIDFNSYAMEEAYE